jgi:hypothetical protein
MHRYHIVCGMHGSVETDKRERRSREEVLGARPVGSHMLAGELRRSVCLGGFENEIRSVDWHQ